VLARDPDGAAAVALVMATVAEDRAGGCSIRRDLELRIGARAEHPNPALVFERGQIEVRSQEAADALDHARRDLGRETADLRVAIEAILRLVGLPETHGAAADAVPFYRVTYAEEPDPALRRVLEDLHGAPLLFDDGSAPPSSPRRVRGAVLHNDMLEDPLRFTGARNPALDASRAHAELADRWAEHQLLVSAAPELAPERILASELGDFPRRQESGDPRPRLAALGARLGERFPSGWLMKPRRGFGSDGRLPTHEHDLLALWSTFEAETVPARDALRARISDPDRLIEALYEDVEGAEALPLEEFLRDPSSVLVEAWIEHQEELRLHIVEGEILDGATTTRWWREGPPPEREVLRRAERALEPLLSHCPRLSCSPDLLLTAGTPGGFRLIDLNPGIESGMYYPENDLFIAQRLAEHFLGRPTPYLAALRRFERAPLSKKLPLARALIERAGRWAKETGAFGLFDRIVLGYIDAARTPATCAEARRQLAALQHEGLDPSELEAFDAHASRGA
jgi:hypothetical protein